MSDDESVRVEVGFDMPPEDAEALAEAFGDHPLVADFERHTEPVTVAFGEVSSVSVERDGGGPEGFDYGEKREDGQYENYPTIDEGEFQQEPRDNYVHVDGCGKTTVMTGDLPESVARDPEYYTKTFCAGCGEHVPVGEVEWGDGEDWVVDE